MKGKRTMKRILAIVMAVAFTVTGITFTPKENVKAISYTDVPGTGEQIIDGNGSWGFRLDQLGSSVKAGYSGGGKNATDIYYRVSDHSDNFTRILIPFKNAGTIVAGETYDYKITIESDTAEAGNGYNSVSNIGWDWGTWTSDASWKAITAGTTTITGTFTPNSDGVANAGARVELQMHTSKTAEWHVTFEFITAQSGPTDPVSPTATRDSATAGTISWTHDANMPSGQIYYIYDGNTKIGETTAGSNTSYEVTGIADFNAHTYTVKGYYDGDTSTGVSATIPEFDPWIQMTAGQTLNLDDGNNVYNADPGTNGMAYYYNSTSSWKTIKLKQLRTPRAVADAGWQRINVRGDKFYKNGNSNLIDGHSYIAKLKYKASEASGSLVMDLPGIHGYDHTIDNSGNTWNYIESGSFTYDSSLTNIYGTGATVQIKVGAAGTGVILSDFDVEFEDLTTPVAPASVTATRSTSTWNGIDINFTAGSGAPAGQTYSIEVDGVEIENNATPGQTYTATIDYDEDITVEVIAHIADVTASKSTTINIPEYKPITELNSDPIINSKFRQDWSSDSEFKYKVDSGNLIIKNYTDAAHNMNLYYYQSALTQVVPYYPEFFYTSTTDSTSTVNYGVYTSTGGCQPYGSMSKTTSSSNPNKIAFLVTPTVAQVAAGAYAYINWTLPAGAEYTITNCNAYLAYDPVNAVGVTASSTNDNEVTVTWTNNHTPSYQIYEIALFDSNGTQVGNTVELANTPNSYTFTNVPKGSNYTVNIKARVDQVYASESGVTSNAVNVDDPAPVAPTSVTATRSTTVWNGVNVSFAADPSAPAGQTYSIEVDGVEIENNATPGQTYSTTVSYGTGIGVDVIAHSNGQTATTSTTVDVPEYKPMSQFDADPLNTEFRTYYFDGNMTYKIDSNGDIHFKSPSESDTWVNLRYKKYGLTSAEAYLATMTYTSNIAYTQDAAPYAIDSDGDNWNIQGYVQMDTAATSGNTVTFMVEPDATQVANNAQAGIGFTVPATGEFTITDFTLATSEPPEDLASVGVSSATPNQIAVTLTKPSPSSAPNNQVYEIYLTDTSASTTELVDTVPVNTANYTISNVAKGTYTVTVKAKVASTYASAVGVTSSSIEVHDPAPVAPVIGTCIENPNRAQSIKLQFAEGTGASAQTYTVSIDGYVATPDSGSIAPDTDLYFSEVNGSPLSVGNHSVVVIGTNTEGSASDTEAVTLEWNRASSSWVTGPDNYQFFESYDGSTSWGRLAYKGTSLTNLNVRVDDNGGAYDVQMRKANAQMYSTLTSGRTYTMTFTLRSTQAGTVGWSQEGYGISGTATVTANQDTEITSTFIYDPSKNTRTVDEQEVANNFNLDLSGLPDGAVLTNFDVSFVADPWVIVPSGQQGYDPMPLGDGSALRSQDTGDTAYYYGTDTSFKTIRTKQLMANPRDVGGAFWDELRIPASVFYTGMTDQHWYKAVISYKASAASGSIKVAMPWVGDYVGTITNSGNTPNIITSDGFLYNASDVGKFENATVEFMIGAVGTGVEISDVDVTFVEQPRPVTGLVALSENAQGRNDGQSITAKWNDPISGISQSYVAKLYNANDVLLDTSAAIAGGSGAYSYTFTNVSPINAYYYVVVESTMNQVTVDATSAQVLLSPWTPMITEENVTVGTNTGVSIHNTDNGRFGYWYNCTGAGKDIGDVKVKMISGRTPTIDNPDNSFWERINYDNESVFSGLTNGGKYRLTMTYTASEVPQGGGGNVWIYPGAGATLLEGSHWTDEDGVQSGTNTITGDFTYNSAAAVGQVMQIRLAGLEGGVEISNISFNIEELPVPVSGLVAIPSAGNVITARWVGPTGGTGQTYVAELYNSNDQRIAYSASLPNNTTSYDFTGVTPDANYYVKVVSSLNGETATATSAPVYLDPWVQVVGAEYGGQPISAGNATVFSKYGAISYYYGHTSSLNDLQIKRTAAAESADNTWYDHVYQTNDVVYADCNDGYSYRMAVTYTANSDATGNLIVRREMDGNQDTVIPVESGTHTVNIDFTYNATYGTSECKTFFLLGGLNADSIISGISYTLTELSTWTPGTPGGWQDVGNYGYYIPANHTGSYSTDVGYNFSLKAGEYGGEWSYLVGTKNMEVYPGSTYAYSINFNRDTKVDNPEHPEFEKLYLYVTFDNGTTDSWLQDANPDESGNVSFTGNVDIPDGATTARLFIKSQYVAGNTILSVDSKKGEAYTFEEVWRPVDKLQEVRDGRYVISDRDGGEIMYKPTQTDGTGAISARVINGTEYNLDRPSIKTQFENWNLEEGEEYVATVKVTANKNCNFRIHGDQTVYALTANTETTIPVTFIYKDGYDIQADLGWLGAQDVILSSYSITISEGSVTMDLTNDGTHVKADWSNYEGTETPGKLVYTSNGHTQIVDITGTTQYEFKEGDGEYGYPDNDTEVEIYDSYEVGNPGTKLLRATALADFEIVNARVDGIAHANTNNIIKMTLRNIGTGKVIASDANQKFIYLTARQDEWRNYKYLCPDPQDLDTSVVLNPNEEFDENSPFYERPNIDAWRVAQEGVYTITCQVNETKIIREKDYTNNTATFTVEVSTQLADDTAVLGFQLNSNKEVDGPSQYNPSYRTVCRANKEVVVKEDDKAWTDDGILETVPTGTYRVLKYGFIYALHDQAELNSKNEDELMSFNGAKKNKYIKTYEAKEEVDIDEWTTKEGSTYNEKNSYFFALTLKDLYYTTDQYETTYTFRSYLQFEAGGKTYTVYPKDVYSTSMYDIAEDLYRYKKMPSEQAHNYLYDNILNIVAMKHNYGKINLAMKDALWWGEQETGEHYLTDDNIKIIDNLTKDMYYNALCSDPTYLAGADEEHDAMIYKYSDITEGAKSGLPGIDYGEDNYKYTHDHEFRSIRLDELGQATYDSFLAILNTDGVRYYSDTAYDSVYKWIYGEVDHDNGFYKKVEYSWDSNLDKDFGTE